MTLVPLATFATGLGIVICFETVYAFLDRRWRIPMDKEMWALLCWCGVVLLGVTCHLIPWPPSPTRFTWAPFAFVAFVHLVVVLEEPGWLPAGRLHLPPYVPPTPAQSNAGSNGSCTGTGAPDGKRTHLETPTDGSNR